MSPAAVQHHEAMDESGDQEDQVHRGQGALEPQVYKEYALMSEYNLVIKQALNGIYVIPKAENPSDWMGVIFVRRGIYQGGIFRFSLSIPENFPDSNELPTVEYEQLIYHPFISEDTRRLDLKRYFPDGWKTGTHHIYHVLIFLQRSFYKLDTTNPANPSAATLMENNLDAFREKIAESVRRSREVVYDKPSSLDPHAIRFTPWDSSVHEKIRQKIVGSAHSSTNSDTDSASNFQSDARTSGLSWMDSEQLTILARQTTAPPKLQDPVEKFVK